MTTRQWTLLFLAGFTVISAAPATAQETLRVSRSYDLAELELEDDDSWRDRLTLRNGLMAKVKLGFEEDNANGHWRALFAFVKEELADVDWTKKERWQINGSLLTVVGTPRLQRRLKRVLGNLADAGSERAKVTISIVTLKDNSRSFSDFQPGLSLSAKQLRTLKQDIQSQSGLLFFDVPNGVKKVSRTLVGRNYVADYEVNQTGVLPVINPVIEFLRTGVMGEVQGHWDGDSDELILESRFERCRLLATESFVFDKNRKLELPEIARVRVGTSVRVGLESTTVLSQFIDTLGKRTMILAIVRGNKVKELAWRRYSLRGFGLLRDYVSVPWRSNYNDLNASGYGGGAGLDFGEDEDDGEKMLAPETQLFQALFKEKLVGVGAIASWLFVKGQKLRDYVGLSLRNRLSKRSRLAYRIIELELPPGALPEARQFDALGFAKLRDRGKVTGELSVSGFMRQRVQFDIFQEKRIVTAISTQAGACLILPPTPDPIVTCLNRGYRLQLSGLSETKETVGFEVSGQFHSYGKVNGVAMKYGVVQFPQDLVRRDFAEKATAK
ncbi:MAG: hypothetical protein P1V97_15210, partial [Planctomycetota bacterium]|nr:hypothetical protein [Planctomycetota bacterium]